MISPFGMSSPEEDPSVVSPSWICAAWGAAGRREVACVVAAAVSCSMWFWCVFRVMGCGGVGSGKSGRGGYQCPLSD